MEIPESSGTPVELVRGGSRPVVLLRNAGDESVRVNGLPAPTLAVLGLRDEVQIGECEPLHLSVWRAPHLGPAPMERRQEKCGVCRCAIGDGNSYLCSCGLLLHLNGEEVPERDRMECALLVSRCASCDEEIRLKAGFLYEPGA